MDAAVLTKKDMLVEEEQRMVQAVRKVRSDPNFSDVPIVFIPENQIGTSTSHAHHYLRNEKHVLTMQENPENRYGVPKTNASTIDMQEIMERLLLHGNVYFYEGLKSLMSTAELMKKELLRQMRAYVWEYILSKNNPNSQSTRLTGKKSGQDDLLISTVMIPYWRIKFLEREFYPYIEFKNTYGINQQ